MSADVRREIKDLARWLQLELVSHVDSLAPVVVVPLWSLSGSMYVGGMKLGWLSPP
jgi:hypothetical protein